jgi:hypothetical protein
MSQRPDADCRYSDWCQLGAWVPLLLLLPLPPLWTGVGDAVPDAWQLVPAQRGRHLGVAVGALRAGDLPVREQEVLPGHPLRSAHPADARVGGEPRPAPHVQQLLPLVLGRKPPVVRVEPEQRQPRLVLQHQQRMYHASSSPIPSFCTW